MSTLRGARVLVVVGALTAAVLTGGCGDEGTDPSWVQDLSDDAAEQIELSTGTAPSTTGTSASVPPAEAESEAVGDAPPPLELTGTDLDRVWRSIQAYEEWVLAHPDVELLDAIYVEGTEIHQQSVDLVRQLQDAGAHMVVGEYEILDVEVLEERPGEEATLRYRDSRSSREIIVDATGEVVEREDYEDQPWTWDLTLEVDDQGQWQIAAIEFVSTA